MSRWSRKGARVQLVTVFACDPDSTAPSGGWDARGGFATEGESARARREEDTSACARLGVAPTWLPFGSVDYERHGTDEDVLAAVLAAVSGADALLVPRFPVSHPDHARIAEMLDGADLGPTRTGGYAEQPYASRHRDRAPSSLRPVPVGPADRLAKWRAVREYRSQLPLLGMSRSLRRGPHTLLGAELVTWEPPTNGLPSR